MGNVRPLGASRENRASLCTPAVRKEGGLAAGVHPRKYLILHPFPRKGTTIPWGLTQPPHLGENPPDAPGEIGYPCCPAFLRGTVPRVRVGDHRHMDKKKTSKYSGSSPYVFAMILGTALSA